jgi:hypothetical protein
MAQLQGCLPPLSSTFSPFPHHLVFFSKATLPSLFYTVTIPELWSFIFWNVTQHLLVVSYVLGQPIYPIFKGQAVILLGLLYLEDGANRLPKNISN